MTDNKRDTRKILFIELHAAGQLIISSMWDVARTKRCELLGRHPSAITYTTSPLSSRAIIGYAVRTYTLNGYTKLTWDYL